MLYQLSYFGLLHQNEKNFPIFWDGKGNGKLYSAKF